MLASRFSLKTCKYRGSSTTPEEPVTIAYIAIIYNNCIVKNFGSSPKDVLDFYVKM